MSNPKRLVRVQQDRRQGLSVKAERHGLRSQAQAVGHRNQERRHTNLRRAKYGLSAVVVLPGRTSVSHLASLVRAGTTPIDHSVRANIPKRYD